MRITQGIFATVLMGTLAACGGGGDGYYSDSNENNNTPTTPGTDLNQAQLSLDTLKREGQYLFGNYDPNDPTTAKGYIDHALDTFVHGPLKIAVDTKTLFDKDRSNFTYYPVCFSGETNAIYENTPCYVLQGEKNIKSALNKVSPGVYDSWKFSVTAEDLKSLKITSAQIGQFTGETALIILENQNQDKSLNDIWVAGTFAYPYKQSWGLQQVDQLRVVSMNGEGEYQISTNPKSLDEESKSYGALSIYKDPTSTDGQLYVLQNNSGFDVLINDNPNTPNIEPVSFMINSLVGDANALATYKVKSNQDQILHIPNVSAIKGTRIENESPSLDAKEFQGSIRLEGQNIFTFKYALNGSTLKFKHSFNNITFEGQSTNNNGTINTTLTAPNNLKF